MKKWKCTICSYLHESEEPPEKCFACGAQQNMIVEEVEKEHREETQVEVNGKESVPEEEKQSGEATGKKWKCTVCNYVHVGDEPPEKCPVCGADKSVFIELVEEEKKEDKETEPAKEDLDRDLASEPVPPSQKKDIIANLVMRHHLHPITVHTPNGVIPVAFIFLLLATVLGAKAFEMAAFFNLIFVLISIPAVVGTGYLAWQKKYNGAKTAIFITKIICAAIVAVLLGWLVCWRLIDPEIVLSKGTGTWTYLILGGVVLVATGIAGHLGGKLVFGTPKK